jgi:predicted AAA+ superfamily ATPase
MRYRARLLEQRLLKLAAHFKGVLVTGARQVGKSTLLAHAFPRVKRVTFDPLQDLYGARRDPDLFLDNFPPPVILDEIQFAPELLPALKRRMDANPDPGQYLLSGSQQIAQLHTITESMAGRVAVVPLGPMTPQEIRGFGGEEPWLARYLETPDDPTRFIREAPSSAEGIYRTLWRGSMPGAIDLPDDLIPDYYRSYLSTYIERDIRLQGEIRDVMEFSRFVGLAAALTAQEINVSQLGREIGVSPTTTRHWLDMLASCYQWREIPAYSGNTVKRVSGKRKGYLGDSGLACWLQRISGPDALASNPLLGAAFETLLVTSLLTTASGLAMPPQAWHWRTAGGAEVDLVFERDGKLYPIEIKCVTTLGGHDTRGLHAFHETYGDKVQPGLILYAGQEVYRVSRHATAIPWNAR